MRPLLRNKSGGGGSGHLPSLPIPKATAAQFDLIFSFGYGD